MVVIGFGKTLLAVLAFAPYLLGMGHLFARFLNVANFKQRSRSEQLLWSLVLSAPIGICFLVLAELVLPLRTVALSGFAIGTTGLISAIWHWAITDRRAIERVSRTAFIYMLFLGIYLVLATVPIQHGSRIYESVAAGDWSVRVPITDMALHAGEPLTNPFDGIDDRRNPLRYYYYWYLLCGAVGSPSHLPARAVLSASSVWAAWILIATAWLLLKYLFRPASSLVKLHRLCLLLLPIGCIIGLDILVTGRRLFDKPISTQPELDWWRSDSDFSMSFHTVMLYAPHHAAGMAAMLLAFLLLLPPRELGILPADEISGWKRIWGGVLAAAACAGMVVGCSTYMALFLAFACAIVAVERWSAARDLATLGRMAVAGALSLLISLPFLRGVAHTTSQVSSRVSEPMLHLHIRSIEAADRIAARTQIALHGKVTAPVLSLERWMLVAGYLVIEAGFLGIVVLWQFRKDMVAPRLSFAGRAQWALFAAIALPGLFLSSDALSGVNDIGRHAGFGVRLLAVLWASPLVTAFLISPEQRKQTLGSWRGRVALVIIVVGLVSQAYQVVAQRFYLFLSNKRIVASTGMPFPVMNDSGVYYYDLYHGYQAVRDGSVTIRPGRVLYNPTSTLNSALMIYQSRESVAPEPDCMTAFGGDIDLCHAAIPALQRLFGGVTFDYRHPEWHEPYLPTAMNLSAFSAVCRQHGAAFAVASDQDPAWKSGDSFIWRAKPIFTTPHVRFLACPDTVYPQAQM